MSPRPRKTPSDLAAEPSTPRASRPGRQPLSPPSGAEIPSWEPLETLKTLSGLPPMGLPSPALISQLQAVLLAWFQASHRPLPWRESRNPYHIWVSEIMLQQTQAATVIPYYHRFLEAFPTVTALAEAPLEAVLSQWKGLGYYARARNLHRGAQQVAAQGGRLPETLEGILAVPGIGRYTAGAILSIAHGLPVPLLDGNVARVYSRLFGLTADPGSPAGLKHLWSLAEALVPATSPGDFNQALMELGATVCTPARAECSVCPAAALCQARSLPDPTLLPLKAAKKAVPQVHAVALLIADPAGNLLMGLRPPRGLLGGLWELPTGLLLPEEGLTDAASRIALARAGFSLAFAPTGVQVTHVFTHLRLVLEVLRAQAPVTQARLPEPERESVSRAKGRAGAVQVPYVDWRWVSLEALSSLPVGRATSKALEGLAATSSQLSLFALTSAGHTR